MYKTSTIVFQGTGVFLLNFNGIKGGEKKKKLLDFKMIKLKTVLMVLALTMLSTQMTFAAVHQRHSVELFFVS